MQYQDPPPDPVPSRINELEIKYVATSLRMFFVPIKKVMEIT